MNVATRGVVSLAARLPRDQAQDRRRTAVGHYGHVACEKLPRQATIKRRLAGALADRGTDMEQARWRNDLGGRALGMMQMLMASYAAGRSAIGPERGIVKREDAMDAIVQIAATVDEWLQGGLVPEERSLNVMLMLMVIRDLVAPLPDVEQEELLLRRDLQEAVDALRETRPQ